MIKHLYTLCTAGLILLATPATSQVLLNELQASNSTTIADPDNGEYNDWLELYNAGPTTINLSGWSLSDNGDNTEWYIPDGTTLPAGAFLLIWANGTGTGLHTSFSLSADGEELTLYNTSGNAVDKITFDAQQTDKSFGRQTDGNNPWGYFAKPTPGTSNNTSTFYTDYVRQEPVFSIPGGFYTSPVTVTIIDKYHAGTLRYTLDGAVPTYASPIFGQPLHITATTVVKARMFYPDQLPGPVVTNTYFINEGFEQRGLPVLSLSTNPEYFFGQDSGLYVQDFKPTWEYPIHLEFYEPDGLLGFHHDAGVQVGGENAWILPQKLLNIYSRGQYGGGHFEYQLYPDNSRKRFGDLILRCSGSDWSYTMFRDGLMQGLIDASVDVDDQDFRPCAVYINGQYLGIHNIREKQDADYTEYYHDIDPDSLDYIENNAEIKEGDAIAYQQMVDILNAGVQSDAAFAVLDSVADTQNYTDYMISEIFVANTSWGHNIALFRKRSAEGRWRWLLHDYDRGFNLGNVNGIGMNWFTTPNGSDGANSPWATVFLRNMLENPAFKERFITRFADHLYITYNPATINRRVDLHANWIRPEMPKQIARWLGTTSSYGNAIPSFAFWENEVAKLKQYGVQRNTYMFSDLNSFFGLGGISTLNLEVSNAAHGSIRLHDLDVHSYPWTGKYIQDRPFTLAAEAKPGFNFVRWEKTNNIQSTIFPAGSTWSYSDATTAPPADWNQPSFDDSAWASGGAQLGYGDGDEVTTLSFGGNSSNKTPSYYFRTKVNIADPNAISSLLLRLIADDGAVVYLNGQEIWRVNMAAAPVVIGFNTFALSSVSGTAENAWNELTLPSTGLNAGENIIAVEIHQSDGASSDISFDLELQAVTHGTPEILSTNAVLETTLDANPLTLRAVFESDGTCGTLPDTLKQNQTLSIDCSPYIAAGDVVVLPNVTLTVDPGVEIRFPDHANLWVLGDLHMNGSAQQPILVKNINSDETWGGIFLKNTTAASSMSYVKIEHASAGSNRLYFPAAISAYHANMQLDHLDLTAVDDNPIFSRFSDVELRDSRLRSAVTGDCINVKQGYAIVENCTFEGGTQPDMDAIDYDGVTGGIIRNNLIHDFRGDNCDGLDIGEQCQDLLIENNSIYYCFDKGISVGQQSTATIQNNLIAHTAIGIALKDESVAEVQHCTFYGNQQGVSAYEKNPGNLGGSGSITDCIVSNAALDAYVYDTYSGLTLTRCMSDLDSISTPGNWNTDPHFVNPTVYDFNLLPSSPAIGSGNGGSNLGPATIVTYGAQPAVMISEILYNDTLTATGEFLEIFNPGSGLIDLTGYTLSAAVDFSFPAGSTIAPGEVLVVAKDATNFNGASFPVYEWSDGKLKNEGEVIYLFDANGLLVDFVRYNNHAPWPESNTLLGRSLELVAANLDNHFATSWQPSAHAGGTPGEFTPVTVTTTLSDDGLVQLYPNPVTDQLNVLVGEEIGAYTIRICDLTGKEILRKHIGDGASQATLDMHEIQAGFHFVILQSYGGEVIRVGGVMVGR